MSEGPNQEKYQGSEGKPVKLHSKFHDYYDSALRFGQSDRHFVRETKEFCGWSDKDYRVHPPLSNTAFSFDVYFGVIVFCGKVYPFALKWNFGDEREIVYSPEKILERDDLSANRGWPTPSKDSVRAWFEREQYGDDFCAVFKRNNAKLVQEALRRRVAYYSIVEASRYGTDGAELTEYPSLKSLQFYRVMDPMTCLQEIELFLNNDLAPLDKPPVWPVPDKIKAESHGFDRFSFRKGKA